MQPFLGQQKSGDKHLGKVTTNSSVHKGELWPFAAGPADLQGEAEVVEEPCHQNWGVPAQELAGEIHLH